MTVRKKRLVFFLGVALLATALFAFRPVPHVDGRRYNRNQNGLWLGHRWFTGGASQDDVRQLAAHCQQCGIQELYVHVGPLDAKGQIPDWKSGVWLATLHQLRTAIPRVQVYAWVGGVTTDVYGVGPDTVDLNQRTVVDAVATTACRVDTDGQFDGIHYDMEVIPSGQMGLVALLDITHRGLSNRLSVAVPMIKPPLLPTRDRWTQSFLHDVAAHADEIAVMANESSMPTKTLYRRLLAWEVPTCLASVHGLQCRVVMGVPTYRDRTYSHNPAVEHVLTSLTALPGGYRTAGITSGFQGVAVYAEWTTEPQDWQDLADHFGCPR